MPMSDIPYSYIQCSDTIDSSFFNVYFHLNRDLCNDSIIELINHQAYISHMPVSYKLPLTQCVLIIFAIILILFLIIIKSNFPYCKNILSSFYIDSKRKIFFKKFSLNNIFNYLLVFIYLITVYIFLNFITYTFFDKFLFSNLAILILAIVFYKIFFMSIYSWVFEIKEQLKADLLYYLGSYLHIMFIMFIFLLIYTAYQKEVILTMCVIFIYMIFIYRWIRMINHNLKFKNNLHIIYFLYFCIQELVPFVIGYSYLKNILY